MFDTATITEPTLDQQLEALLKPETKPSGEGTPPKPDAAAQPVASPAAPITEDPLETSLKDIPEEPKEDAEAKPALSTEQQSILAAIPSAEVATQLYATVENYSNFTSAFEARKFEQVVGMFEAWDKDAFDDFLNHVYTTKVASGEWVDRFIAEQEGGGKQHQGMRAMERKIAQMRAELDQKNQGQQQTVQQQHEQQAFVDYTKHVETLFEKIKFSASDRRWVVADLNARVGSNPKVLAALKAGNITAANGLFKEAVRDYVNRDKQTADATAAKVELQSQKKVPVSGGVGSPESGALPDDIKQVPKGQEDSWMDAQLAKLAKLVKR